MNVEIIERAIARLEELKAGATSTRHDAEWVIDPDPGIGGERVISSHNAGWDGAIVADVEGRTDAQLIVTLWRTVDPVTDFLRFARGMAGARIQGEQAEATVDLAVYLARAVLGAGEGSNE